MAYGITRADLGSITDVELAFSTERLLPAWEDVPEAFRRGNVFTQLADAIFSGAPLPEVSIAFREGFTDPAAPEALNRCVRAHLQSWSPKHEHKIAGVGLMISCVCDLQCAASTEEATS